MRNLHRTTSLMIAALGALAFTGASGRATAQFAARGASVRGSRVRSAPVTRVVPPAVPPAAPRYRRDGVVADERLRYVTALGDLNRDNTPDFAVGASAGRGYVLLCSGVDGAVLRQIDGEATGDRFGVIAPAGDFNRDGFPDLLVGAPGHASAGRADSGKIYVYSGDLNDPTPLLIAVDGPTAGENMGASVAAAGDVDGNGQIDILAGAPSATVAGGANAGCVYLWSGSNGTELRHWDGETAGDRFGEVVASAGDANRDARIDYDADGNGRSDFIATAPRFDPAGRTDAGRVYVFRSLSAGASNYAVPDVLDGLAAGDLAGASAASVGDLNGDNQSDIVIGAPGVGGNDRGALYVHSGALGVALYSIPGSGLLADGDGLGESVAGVGDANGDGTPDFISGVPNRNSGAGGALVFSGWDGSLLVGFNGSGTGQRFGAGVAGAGDLNNDGRTELLISLPLADTPAPLSEAGIVLIQYVPNQPPVAQNDNFTISEDQPLLIPLPGVLSNDTDADRNPITASLLSGPLHGAVTLASNGAFDYTPTANYFGSDSFTYRAFDGIDFSAPATVQITINAVNDLPEALSVNVTTREDTQIGITLLAPDVENDPVTFSLATNPAHGTLSGTLPNLIYTPAPNYSGPDTFTFHGSDPFGTGPVGTITISVTPVNDAPFLSLTQSLTVIEDTPTALNLEGTDPEGSPLFFTIVTPPQHGTLSGGPGRGRTYTPALNYTGADSLQYTVSDGTLESPLATVNITVTPVNDAPVANAQTVSTPYQTAVNITLTGSDAEGSPLAYTIVGQPAHGTLSGSGSSRTYTPAALYFGPDTFTFKVNDSAQDSAPGTVTINVAPPPNEAPTANPQTVTTPEDNAKAIVLQASDPDSSPFPLVYTIVSAPTHGTLSGTAPDLLYTPAADYNGADTFTFKVFDGLADSNTATVTVNVSPVNDAPVATGHTLTTPEDTPLNLVLDGFDVDGDALTYTIINPPVNGTLAGTDGSRIYTPAAEYTGSDSFTFQVSDGITTSAVVTVQIVIPAVNDRPVAASMSVVAKHFRTTSITLR
ncbi:MAG: hypothetical protein K0Q72_2553, partial [Armatimonadetes bacterium]|nr:hypothetical protein [Armatimonadota bacterium]